MSGIARVVVKSSMTDAPSDLAHWRSRPPAERIEALTRLRREFEGWTEATEPRLPLVARVLVRYAESLNAVGSRLVLVSTNERIEEQLAAAGMLAVIGNGGLYRGDERAGATLQRAVADARAWIAGSASES